MTVLQTAKVPVGMVREFWNDWMVAVNTTALNAPKHSLLNSGRTIFFFLLSHLLLLKVTELPLLTDLRPLHALSAHDGIFRISMQAFLHSRLVPLQGH